jgi:hypothetical protein
LVRAWTTEPQLHNGVSKQQQYCYGHQKYQYFQILMGLLVCSSLDWINWAFMETIMTNNRKSHPREKKGERKSNQPLPANDPTADFVPQEIDETAEFEGQCIAIIGGVQPPKKTKADFVPTVTDETVPGECTGIIGVSIPPKKTTRQRS